MAAAWAAFSTPQARDDCKYIPYAFGYKLRASDYTDQNVVFVDSCPPRDILIEMQQKARNIWVLDHHKTGRENCSDIDGTYFNFNMSGASIAWRAFHGSEKMPLLIQYTEDIDLWRFKLPLSRSVQTALYSVPFTFETFEALADNTVFKKLIAAGVQLTEYRDSILDKVANEARTSTCRVDGTEYSFTSINLPYFASAMGDKLKNGTDFVAIWHVKADGNVKFSLRSQDTGADVSLIAARLNPQGGGHRNSAGAVTTLQTALQFLNGDFNGD